MKNFYTILSALTITTAASAQCLTVSCNSTITVNNDPGTCGAVVSFPAPTYTNSCLVTVGADTFQYTGAQQIYTVPAGVTSIRIETWGAQGGANWANNINFGGYVAGDISVTPGEQLYVYVGGQATTTAGGFNGGGSGEGAGKGGGGGTDVRQGGSTYNDRVVCAGGGGGAGYWSALHVVGGQGGGLTGGNGYRDPDFASNPGGKGGTQSGGGPDGTCVNFNVTACAGGFGYGGSITGCGCEVYGGGGGWYGGAASGNCRGGGGGSGYAIPTAANVSMSTGVRAGNGMVVITYQATGTVTTTQVAGLPSGATFPVGQTINTFVADDGFGNTDTCSFAVNVIDIEAPVLAQPANVSQPVAAAGCGANVSWAAPAVTENCSASVISTPMSGSYFTIGTHTVTVIANDGNQTDTATFTVTVVDTVAPYFSNIPSDMTVNTDSAMCSAIVSWSPLSLIDNCGSAFTASHMPGDVFPVGNTTVTYIATDSSGLSDTASFIVTVVDAEAPVITSCPMDITVPADSGMCSASNINLGSATATDNCAAAVTSNAPSTFPLGTTTVTWTAADAEGNTTTCMQTVTVVDNEAPVIGCPMDMMACEGVVSFLPPAATDNCSGATVTQISGPTSGSTLAAGLYTIVFAAMDSSGNADSCSFTLTVNANPVITMTVPATVCVNDGSYTLSAAPAGGTWSGPGVSGGTFSPSAAGNGAHSVTYTYTNANGCSASSSDLINVLPCTGINEAGAITFSMFPNPASTAFTFTCAEHGTVELLDASGKVVLAQTVTATQTEIDIAGFATGVYLVRFTSTSGAISTGKLQVQY